MIWTSAVGGEETVVKASKETLEEKVSLPDRVTIRLNDEMKSIMAEIQNATRAPTPTDVVKRALIVYHTLVAQKMAGNEPVIVDRSTPQERNLPIFL